MLFKITRVEGQSESEETREAETRQEMQEQFEAENPNLKLTAASDAADYAIYKGGNIMVIIKPVLLVIAGLLIFKYVYE